MRIDIEGHRIILENDIIYLTTMQNDILKLLYRNKNKVVKYDVIAIEIYKSKDDKYIRNNIRKQVSLLNEKIGEYIRVKNVREVGYIMEEDLK